MLGLFSSSGNKTNAVDETQVATLIHFAYVIIFVASLFGNSVIMHIIIKENTMKNATNYLIINQACADLLISLSSIVEVYLLHPRTNDRLWFKGIVGHITCKFFVSSMYILPVFSVWILATIAVDRFYAVTRPLRTSPIAQHLKKTILLLWILSIFTSSDVIVSAKVEKVNESYYHCDSNNAWTTFTISTLTLKILLPLLLIAVLYTVVCLKLWSREVPGEGTNQNREQVEVKKTARKVTRMMIVIVLLYVVCWFPFFISVTLQFFGVPIDNNLLLFLIWFTIVYSGLNPYVYLTLSQRFRNNFKTLFGTCIRKAKISNIISFRSKSVDLQQI